MISMYRLIISRTFRALPYDWGMQDWLGQRLLLTMWWPRPSLGAWSLVHESLACRA